VAEAIDEDGAADEGAVGEGAADEGAADEGAADAGVLAAVVPDAGDWAPHGAAARTMSDARRAIR
jgi:hypothetical protein